MQIHADEFDTAWEAVQHTDAAGYGSAIRLQGRNLVIDDATADRLAEAGVEFAYLTDHRMPDGTNRIMTVPVND